MDKSTPTAEAVAQKLEKEKQDQLALEKTTRTLYSMRCFETLNHPSGVPIAMRVPGGWLFYTIGGGGGLQLITGDEDGEQQIVGQLRNNVVAAFVPYSSEFIDGPDPIALS